MSNKITFDERNYRHRSPEAKEVLGKSLDQNGVGRSILLDNEGGIIAGNGVYEQALERDIPVQIVETDGEVLIAVQRKDIAPGDEKRRNLALADNATGLLSEWNVDLIRQDFTEEDTAGWGVFLPSEFSEGDMNEFFREAPNSASGGLQRLTFDFTPEQYAAVVGFINGQELSKEELLLKLIGDADLS